MRMWAAKAVIVTNRPERQNAPVPPQDRNPIDPSDGGMDAMSQPLPLVASDWEAEITPESEATRDWQTEGCATLPLGSPPIERDLSIDVASAVIDRSATIETRSVLGQACRHFHHGIQVTADLTQCRQRLRRLCPAAPGVYRWFDTTGKLIYIGKAKSLMQRLLTYFCVNPSDEKMRRIRDVGQRIVWEETSHEFLALVREQELIAHFRPAFNSQGQPQRKRPAFLCVSNHRAANVYVSFDGTKNADVYFGPVLGSRHLREAAETLNHHFALRDCSDRTPIDFGQQLMLFPSVQEAHCLRHEIGTCLGPCAAKVSQAEYQLAVHRVLDFLRGFDKSLFLDLEQQMQIAAKALRFEKASALRDRLRLLKWLDRRLEDLRRTAFQYNCVYPVTGSGTFGRAKEQTWWVFLAQGSVVNAVRCPSNKVDARRALRELKLAQQECLRPPAGEVDHTGGKHISGKPDANTRQNTVARLLMHAVVTTWFRRHKAEKTTLLNYAAAAAHCEALLTSTKRTKNS